MKRYLSMILLGAAVLAPSIVHAQWAVTYGISNAWYKDYPIDVNNVWSEAQATGSTNGSRDETVQVGSCQYLPLKMPNLYQEVGAQGAVDITVYWNGDPALEPSTVNISITTQASAWYNYAIYGSGILTINDGFGGSGPTTQWTNSDGSQSGSASLNHTQNLGSIPTYGHQVVYQTQVVMNEQAHARLIHEYPGDFSGDNGVNVGVDWTLSVQAN